MYLESDIKLIPLRKSTFNGYKSNLKILEAAGKGIPVIVSKVNPYLGFPEDVVYYENWEAVKASVPNEGVVRVIKENLNSYAEYWNQAIYLCVGKWIAICNVDDYFLPKALNSIPEAEAAGCNLVCDWLRTKGSDSVQQTKWLPETLDYEFELGGANPMTKHLWQASGGFPEGIRFADWGLALHMRKTGLVKPWFTARRTAP